MAKQLVPTNEVFVIDGGACNYSGCSFLSVYLEEYWGIGLTEKRTILRKIHFIDDRAVEMYRANGLKIIPANKIKE